MIVMKSLSKDISADEFANFYFKLINSHLSLLGIHSSNVTQVALDIAKQMNFKISELTLLKYGSMFHDVGKLLVPAEMLNSPRQLTFHEFEIIKTHTNLGYDALSNIESFEDIKEFALMHHYRSGKGYPEVNKHKVDDLLVEILTAADCFCAVIEPRVYKKPINQAEAIRIITDKNNPKNEGLDSNVIEVLKFLVSNDRLKLNNF